MDPETFRLLLDTVCRFVSERLIPREAEVVMTDAIPYDVARVMKDLGQFGLSVAEEFGGLGLSMDEEVRVVFELGRA